jgi:hypothetical protein
MPSFGNAGSSGGSYSKFSGDSVVHDDMDFGKLSSMLTGEGEDAKPNSAGMELLASSRASIRRQVTDSANPPGFL